MSISLDIKRLETRIADQRLRVQSAPNEIARQHSIKLLDVMTEGLARLIALEESRAKENPIPIQGNMLQDSL